MDDLSYYSTVVSHAMVLLKCFIIPAAGVLGQTPLLTMHNANPHAAMQVFQAEKSNVSQ